MSELLECDGFKLIENGTRYKVVSFEGVDIEAGTLAEVDNDFVTEPIQKCDRKIND